MNTPDHRKSADPAATRDATRRDAEWQAQERAVEQERRGVPLDDADPRLAEYRLIARALRSPAMEPMPFDLAERIVQHVEASTAWGERVERWLLRILGGVFALAALVAVTLYGPQWAPSFSALWPSMSAQSGDWAMLLLACLGVSLGAQVMVRLLRHDEPVAGLP